MFSGVKIFTQERRKWAIILANLIGFQLEGLLRSNAVKNGKVVDMKMYSRVKTVDTECVL